LPRIAALMMSGMCASVQAELDGLFGQIEGAPVRTRGVSAQAFSQMRRGLTANVFEALNARLLDLAGDYVDAWRWHGLRVVAADGSLLTVATRKGAQLRSEHYAFALFLPGAELTLHASLHPADGSERQMLFESFDRLQPLTARSGSVAMALRYRSTASGSRPTVCSPAARKFILVPLFGSSA
jgi:hypothetical protein